MRIKKIKPSERNFRAKLRAKARKRGYQGASSTLASSRYNYLHSTLYARYKVELPWDYSPPEPIINLIAYLNSELRPAPERTFIMRMGDKKQLDGFLLSFYRALNYLSRRLYIEEALWVEQSIKITILNEYGMNLRLDADDKVEVNEREWDKGNLNSGITEDSYVFFKDGVRNAPEGSLYNLDEIKETVREVKRELKKDWKPHGTLRSREFQANPEIVQSEAQRSLFNLTTYAARSYKIRFSPENLPPSKGREKYNSYFKHLREVHYRKGAFPPSYFHLNGWRIRTIKSRIERGKEKTTTPSTPYLRTQFYVLFTPFDDSFGSCQEVRETLDEIFRMNKESGKATEWEKLGEKVRNRNLGRILKEEADIEEGGKLTKKMKVSNLEKNLESLRKLREKG